MGLSLTGAGLSVDLAADPFQHLDAGSGWGLPPVSLQWQDGAGDGSELLGGRTLRRPLTVPILVRGANALEVDQRINLLGRMLAPGALAQFRRTDPAGETWALGVVRESGGDWTWGKDTDGSTWAEVVLGLVAGRPYWTRERSEAVPVAPANATAGLLSPYSLSELRLASSQAFGTVTLNNPGSAPSPLVVVVNGPADHLEVTGPGGERQEWNGTLAAGEWLRLERGRLYDDTGANRYDELAPAPQPWAVQPGTQTAQVSLTGAGGTTSVVLSWAPRKWAQFA